MSFKERDMVEHVQYGSGLSGRDLIGVMSCDEQRALRAT